MTIPITTPQIGTTGVVQQPNVVEQFGSGFQVVALALQKRQELEAAKQKLIQDREKFFRGDCNFSRMGNGMAVDIADAAAVVSFLFLPGTMKFQPPCLDACDCNDDGRIDLADAVCILQYLFQFGRFPPAPGPGLRVTGNPNPNMVEPTPPGLDPTDDKLDCAAGGGCD